MASVADELRADLDRLIAEGEKLRTGLVVKAQARAVEGVLSGLGRLLDEREEEAAAGSTPKSKVRSADRVDAALKKQVLDFQEHYESWYSEASAMISQVLPDRVDDFRRLYKVDRRKDIDAESYTLSDYQLGLEVRRYQKPVFDHANVAFAKFTQQLNIVIAAKRVLESRLADIRGVLQADLFDSELDAARELLKNGFMRAAGVVAGVVLERHLAEVARSHRVTVRSKSPTISTYNDALKKAEILNVPRWRSIQGLADIRNLCGHPGERDPTREEVAELIDGVGKITKSVS